MKTTSCPQCGMGVSVEDSEAIKLLTKCRNRLSDMGASTAHAVSWVRPHTDATDKLVEELDLFLSNNN